MSRRQSGLSEQCFWWQWPFNSDRQYRHICSKLNLLATGAPTWPFRQCRWDFMPGLLQRRHGKPERAQTTQRYISQCFWSVISLYWSWQPGQQAIKSSITVHGRHAKHIFVAGRLTFPLSQWALLLPFWRFETPTTLLSYICSLQFDWNCQTFKLS